MYRNWNRLIPKNHENAIERFFTVKYPEEWQFCKASGPYLRLTAIEAMRLVPMLRVAAGDSDILT
jgi:hypothetical protein